MKFIKMRVKHTEHDNGKGGKFEYPPDYDPQKVKLGPVYFWSQAKGNPYCDIIFGVKDSDADQFLWENGREVDGHKFLAMEVTEEECVEAFREHSPVNTTGTVSDTERVLNILAKSARGIELTQVELDALDPEKDEAGINNPRKWDAIVATTRRRIEKEEVADRITERGGA